jgi:hypothetical protein
MRINQDFNMGMSPVFPFCVPVAAGIVFVFMVNPHTIFLNAPFGLRHVMPPPPPLWHPLWSDDSREGKYNTIAKPRSGSGGQGEVPFDNR